MSSDVDQLLARFGDERDLLAAIKRQKIVQGNDSAAAAFVAAGKLVGFGSGETIITQGNYDRTAYFLLAGKVGLTINNLLLVVDKLILPADIDLSLWRNATVLLSMAVLLYGLIWDTE